MKRLTWLIVLMALALGCASTRPCPVKTVVVKVPVATPCPDPGPDEKVEWRAVRFVPAGHKQAAACLTWKGLKDNLANLAACKGALERCMMRLDAYRSPLHRPGEQR
ncbi:MAG: hypothetical protein KJ621_07490 [Proteobacteria bacterium]|nr:hypothetical protein [Pseudomonadota bacterium]